MHEETPDEKAVRTVVTSGTNVRLATSKSKKRRKKRAVIVVSTEEVAGGFVDFLRKNAVVALAVGFVIATQVQVLAKQLITSFIDPLFTLLFGSNLSARAFSLSFHDNTVKFTWGSFVYALVNFLFVVLCLYLVIKFFKLDRLDQSDEDTDKK